MLSPYRILDLSDEKGMLCSKILGDLGADVIQIEPPGGSPARKIGPFYKDQIDPEKSLYWFAYNTNKRGITLDLDSVEGREIFKSLVIKADIIIESTSPGEMTDLGLGYTDLCKLKPDLILTSITPFGQEGPYRDFTASDLTCWAMSGFLYLTGDADRPPVQVSFPQAYLNASQEAAAATMIALYHHEMTGEGQHVDVSIQASATRNTMNAPLFWETLGLNIGRAGPFRIGLSVSSGQRVIWKCKDGEISFFIWGGKSGYRINSALTSYMDEEGKAPEFMKQIDWENFDISTASEELFEKLTRHIEDFFLSHSKAELFEQGRKRGITIYPVQTVKDIAEDPQLEFRKSWEKIEHPELQEEILYPKQPFILSQQEGKKSVRAPLIGEHNREIYIGDMGFSEEKLNSLVEQGII